MKTLEYGVKVATLEGVRDAFKGHFTDPKDLAKVDEWFAKRKAEIDKEFEEV